MKIILNNDSMVPIYEQVVGQIKNQILEGSLIEGIVLPSVRALAGELRISALTVKKAYDALESEGFVTTVHGKGTYVKAINKQLAEDYNRQQIEACFTQAIDRARAAGFDDAEIIDLLSMLLEDQRRTL